MSSFQSFAEAASQPRTDNRRITIRYHCAPATAGQVIASDDQEYQRAWIENLSKGGVGLYLTKPVPAGGIIVVQLKAPVGNKVYELSGQVAHTTLREPYGWYIGIEFLEPLDDSALESLL